MLYAISWWSSPLMSLWCKSSRTWAPYDNLAFMELLGTPKFSFINVSIHILHKKLHLVPINYCFTVAAFTFLCRTSKRDPQCSASWCDGQPHLRDAISDVKVNYFKKWTHKNVFPVTLPSPFFCSEPRSLACISEPKARNPVCRQKLPHKSKYVNISYLY